MAQLRSEQSGSTRRPVSINDAFFAGLSAIISDMRQTALKAVSASTEVPLSKVKAIADREYTAPERPPQPKTDEEFRALEAAISEGYLVERVLRETENRTEVSYNLTFVNGYSAQTDSLDNLKDVLATEPARLDWLSVRAGGHGGHLSFALRLFKASSQYDVSGDRREVDHIVRRLKDLLDASEPDHAWLYRWWFRGVVILITVAGVLIAGNVLVTHLNVSERTAGLLRIGNGAVAGLVGSTAASELMARAFPRCQVEYGLEWRRQKARRTLVVFLLTALLIPIGLEIVF